MAHVTISAWDIAQMFGLEYTGLKVNEAESENMGFEVEDYAYDFHGKEYVDKYRMYRSREDADENVAEQVLFEIGKLVSNK